MLRARWLFHRGSRIFNSSVRRRNDAQAAIYTLASALVPLPQSVVKCFAVAYDLDEGRLPHTRRGDDMSSYLKEAVL